MAGSGGSGNSGGSSRKHCWLLLLLVVVCSGLYLLLYYRASLSTSTFLFPRTFSRSDATLHHTPPLATAHDVAGPRGTPDGQEAFANSSEGVMPTSSSSQPPPLLTLFSTWVDREDQSLVRNLTMVNWAQLRPAVLPVLFTSSDRLAVRAEHFGWHTLPVSKMAIGVPVLKYMYLDAMKKFNSTLFAYANGDILFTNNLVDSLRAILADSTLLLPQKHIMVVGQRTNVPMVTAEEASTSESIAAIAKRRGKVFTTFAEDYFMTDRNYPWDDIPGVVIGRRAYDNWLVLQAIKKGHVVVDVTKTVLAVHQTTKAGNYEGFTHANSSYNDNMLTRLYKNVHYSGGCVDCTPLKTELSAEGKVHVVRRGTKPKHC